MNDDKRKILFWGSGKMATAIATGLATGTRRPVMSFYSPSGVSAHQLAQQLGANVFTDSLTQKIDYIVLGFKPQQYESACADLLKILPSLGNPTIISILAGIRLERIEKTFENYQVARVMPNTPILVGEGLMGWIFSEVAVSLQTEILDIFSPCALQVVLSSEEELDHYTAIAGSGPAYIFEFARILEAQYLELGLPPEYSRSLVAKLFLGSAKLMNESRESFESLRTNVTSKGGVTASALEVFQQHNFSDTVKLALESNIARSSELARE